MNATYHLEELTRQIRTETIRILRALPETWLTWAPAGTSNHILWHAGHAIWVQDLLCIEPLSGTSELPDGWAETFGGDCRPVATTHDWPARDEIATLLELQLARMLELFEGQADRIVSAGPLTSTGWQLTPGLLHGLHDEARHQGEMFLLSKLCRQR